MGVHRPMRAELTLDHLDVTGTIPPTLHGRYLKMGANPARPDHAGHHWFLGDGMVHEFTLGPAPTYRNRWIRSRIAAAALGRDPAPGPRHGRPGSNDTVNTNIVPIAGRPYAIVEAGSYPVALSPTLDDQCYDPFDGTLTGSFTGHPHLDPLTGEQHAICYDGGIWDSVRHVVIAPNGRVTRELAIPVRDGPCVHDCAITARYVIVFDLPVNFSMRAVLGGHAFPFRWNKAHPARIGLLPRHGTADDIMWCPLDPCFVFHVANAYDEGDPDRHRVVMDLVAYPTMFTGDGSGLDTLGHLERWSIDPATRRVDRHQIDDTPLEFPRIDERRFGQPHRYVYTVAVPPDGNTQLRGATRLHRFDRDTNTRTEHDFGDGHLPGEFIFVPDGPAETEGWLMGTVLNVAAETTDLVILDARHFEADPVATIHLPHAIPPGFHGNWFPT